MAGKVTPKKILLDESEMPTQWYNLVADLPTPPPPALTQSGDYRERT